MKIKAEKFGITKNNEEVLVYTIEGLNIKAEFLNYGCTIKSLYMPNKLGVMENIVLGFEDLSYYDKEETSYFGCIVGRTAGRTKNGLLEINDDIYQLQKNNGKNNLHGGINGLHKKVWKSSYEVIQDKAIITFTTISPHMEEGFPGEVEFTIKYIIQDHSLTLEYIGIPDRDTYINLTNHIYFNLSGNFNKEIYSHEFFLNSCGYFAVDNETLPIEFIENDDSFTSKKPILLDIILKSNHKQMEIVGNGYDHAFELTKDSLIDGYIEETFSGRRVDFKTDQPVVVFYTGNNLDGIDGLKKHTGFCLETQDYPDIKNIKPNKMKIYNKQNHYTQTTIYKFHV